MHQRMPDTDDVRTPSAVAIAVVVLASGCSGSENPETDVLYAGDVAVLVETEEYDGSEGAGVGWEGKFAVVEDCVGMISSEDEPIALVLPPGTTVSGRDADLVIRAGDREYRIGDRFDSGTRVYSPQPLDEFGTLSEQAPESCRDLDAIVLNDLSY